MKGIQARVKTRPDPFEFKNRTTLFSFAFLFLTDALLALGANESFVCAPLTFVVETSDRTGASESLLEMDMVSPE